MHIILYYNYFLAEVNVILLFSTIFKIIKWLLYQPEFYIPSMVINLCTFRKSQHLRSRLLNNAEGIRFFTAVFIASINPLYRRAALACKSQTATVCHFKCGGGPQIPSFFLNNSDVVTLLGRKDMAVHWSVTSLWRRAADVLLPSSSC